MQSFVTTFATIVGAMALKLKSLIFATILIAAMTALVAKAQLGPINLLFDLIRIQGTVYCTSNGNMGTYGSATAVFPNAEMQLQCGGSGVSSAMTDANGEFSIVLNPVEFALASVLNNCYLVVNTPLGKCNADLPSMGSLISSLHFTGNALLGFFTVANVIPEGFRFVPST